ncbi:MAG: hypothetical protein ACQETE_05380 [Bacteroidota bacterium]
MLNRNGELGRTPWTLVSVWVMMMIMAPSGMAQDRTVPESQGRLFIGFNAQQYQDYRLNNVNLGQARFYEVSFGFSELQHQGYELDVHLGLGFGKVPSFSPGFSLAYLLEPFPQQFLKVGLSLDRLFEVSQSDSYRQNENTTLDDDFERKHDSVRPFVGYQFIVFKHLSLNLNASYRFMRSFRYSGKQLFFSPGFNVDAGLRVYF